MKLLSLSEKEIFVQDVLARAKKAGLMNKDKIFMDALKNLYDEKLINTKQIGVMFHVVNFFSRVKNKLKAEV